MMESTGCIDTRRRATNNITLIAGVGKVSRHVGASLALETKTKNENTGARLLQHSREERLDANLLSNAHSPIAPVAF